MPALKMEKNYLSVFFLVGFAFVTSHQSTDDMIAHYVLIGGDIEIDCIPTGTSISFHSSPKYVWLRKGIHKLKGNVAVDKEKGSLSLMEAVVQNTDEYQCHVSSGDGVKNVFAHVIVVFDIPIISEEVLLSYRAFRCNPHVEGEKLEKIRKALCGRLKRAVCPLRLSSFCENRIFKGIRVEHRLKIFIRNTIPRYFRKEKCKNDEKCAALKLRKLFRNYQHKTNHFIHSEIESAKQGSEFLTESVIRYEADLMRRHTQVGCAGGYKLELSSDDMKSNKVKIGSVVNKLPRDFTSRCVPCSPGTYSAPGDIVCHHCHPDTYQDGFGHTACKICPKGKETEGFGTKSILECLNDTALQHRRHLHIKSVEHRKSILLQQKLQWTYIGLGCAVIFIVFVIPMAFFLKNRKTLNLHINYDAGDGQKKNLL